MDPHWKLLVEAGVPDGPPPRSGGNLDPTRVREAVSNLVTRLDRMEVREAELLLAWLDAWRHHWPRKFAEVLRTDGDAALTELRSRRDLDPNRFLKLRRIALENLARLI